jgi:hypothetical protein
MKKKTGNKKVKLAEFKSWLDGFCSAQEEDWVPNKAQWELIKDKIFNLEEMKEHPQTVAQQPYQVHGPSMSYSLPPRPESLAAPQPQQPAIPVKRDGKIVTPSIDSSNGYNSGFE